MFFPGVQRHARGEATALLAVSRSSIELDVHAASQAAVQVQRGRASSRAAVDLTSVSKVAKLKSFRNHFGLSHAENKWAAMFLQLHKTRLFGASVR